MLYRLRKEVADYLSVEIIDESVADIVARFEGWARKKCKRSGAAWAEDEIVEVRNAAEAFARQPERLDSMFELLTPGMWVDGEAVFS